MFEKLEQLRQKSDQQKRYIAFGTAFGISFIIFIFWFVSLTLTLTSGGQGTGSLATDGGGNTGASSPFSAMTANLSAAFVPVENAFGNLAAYFSASSTGSSTASTTTY